MVLFSNIFEISHNKHNTISSMEGMRGFAVLLVFLVHYMTLVEPWLLFDSLVYKIALYGRQIGNVGVDLFFVLSGYLIYGVLINKKILFGKYIARRVQRIYPVFSVVFFIYVLLSFVFSNESKIPNDWVGALIYIFQNYFLLPGIFDIKPIVTVAWSLSYEFFYYFAMPFLVVILSMQSWQPKFRFIFFILLSILAFGCSFFYGGHIRLLMFMPGVLVFECLNNIFLKKRPPFGILFLCFVLITPLVFNYYQFNGVWKYFLLYVFLFLFFLDCFCRGSFTYKLFSLKYIRWLGNMSYSYYLIHGLALKAFFMLLSFYYPASQDSNSLLWVLIVPSFMITLLPSVFLFVFVEKPYSLSYAK
ncbi:acyltransferase [Methylomonas sp.]|jgi:peptidoglycan/LPS O-acetylase OafA/YrhL|uniref:acyltransferase family protein n=1 Tax=Methylomonas sp. TaxID=418 RepID=UPI0025DDB54E|nr:acyltransferase [Methylomonas sp.]